MRVLSNSLVLLAGLLVAQTSTGLSQSPAPPAYANDPRLAALTGFFQVLESPAEVYAEDFLVAADRHGLDWRILPSIAILESGGGKRAINNNILGWDSCQKAFPSVRAGIHFVASRLVNGNLYRGKSLDEILSVYNPNEEYPARAKWLMTRLDSRLQRAESAD